MNNKKDLIVTLADANFIDQAKQLFSSVYFKAGWQGDYLLITHNLSSQDKAWFESRGIIVYDPPLLSDESFSEKSYPPVLFSKFYLFTSYFKKWRKIVFLDADIIVQSSLDYLLQFDKISATKAITLRLKDEFSKQKKLSHDFKRTYNLKSTAFGTGVFVLDTDLIKEDTFTSIMTLHNQFKDICQYGEESILNLYFYKKWHKLPIIFNAAPWYLEKFYGLKTNKFTAVIIHFNCYLIKPWNKESSYYKEWLDNLLLADKIDTSRPVHAAYQLSPVYLRRYLRLLKFKRFVCWLKLDHQIGELGLLIERKMPSLYKVINIRKNDFI